MFALVVELVVSLALSSYYLNLDLNWEMIVLFCHQSSVEIGFQTVDQYLGLSLAETSVSSQLVGHVQTGSVTGLSVVVH